MQDPDERNGRRCLDCSRLFPADHVIEDEFSVLMDSMYGRPPTEVRCIRESCPHCGKHDLEPVTLCDSCFEHEPLEGGSLCAKCISCERCGTHDATIREDECGEFYCARCRETLTEIRAEAAYEASLGECFRGGEAAAYAASQQAEARRLK